MRDARRIKAYSFGDLAKALNDGMLSPWRSFGGILAIDR
jgi:hypothetical protein